MDNRKNQSWKLFDQIAPKYDRINRILSFGIDKRWRKQIICNLPDKSDMVCVDLATGTADVAIELASHNRVKSVKALDLSKRMIALGKVKVVKANQQKMINLVVGNAEKSLINAKSIDVVTVAFGVRNFANYQKSLKEMHRILKKDGRAMILEFSLPKNRLFRSIYLFYLRNVLPKIGKKVSKNNQAYTYLNETIEDFPYGAEFASKMEKAGFKNINIKPLSFGIVTLYIGDKP